MPRKRKRDQDGIFARPDSQYWWASFTDSRGRAARRSTGVRRDQDPDQLKARAVRAQWLLEAETGRADAPQTSGQGHSFDELMLLYLGQVTPAKRAGERDRFSAKRLYPRFSGRVLETLCVADARAYVAGRTAEGAKPIPLHTTLSARCNMPSSGYFWRRHGLGRRGFFGDSSGATSAVTVGRCGSWSAWPSGQRQASRGPVTGGRRRRRPTGFCRGRSTTGWTSWSRIASAHGRGWRSILWRCACRTPPSWTSTAKRSPGSAR